MRDLFDRRLTDPTEVELTETLRAGVEAANAKHTEGNLTLANAYVRQIVDGVRKEPSGMIGHFGRSNRTTIARISLGWWTNPGGRKLVRVRGWRERDRRARDRRAAMPPIPMPEDDADQIFHDAEFDRSRRPGVWHIEHERVIEANTGGESEWVAVCGCGAAGSAESLGWQHGMCGPCADRVFEFGADAVTHAPGLLAEADFEPRDVLFTTDGKFVVAVADDGYCVWDAATGSACTKGSFQHLRRSAQTVASPDGRFVFLSAGNDGLHTIKVGRTGWVPAFVPHEDWISAVHWTGRPGELLLQLGTLAPSGQLVDLITDRVREIGASNFLGSVYAIWPDPNSPRAVFADDHFASVARVEDDGKFAVEARFLLGDGRLNRTGLWQGGPVIVRFTPDGERLLFVRDTEMELRHPAKPKALLQATFPVPVLDAAFSPDYEHLFVLGTDGVVHVCNPGTLTSVRARLRWHVGPVSRLAVSPDGQTLATAGSDGVKLWPVGRLMPLLG